MPKSSPFPICWWNWPKVFFPLVFFLHSERTLKRLFFSVLNNGTQWSPAFSPSSDIPNVKELVQQMKFPRIPFTTWELVVFPKTWTFGWSSGCKPICSKLLRNSSWTGEQSILKCWRTRHRHNRVTCVRSVGPWNLLGGSWLEYGQSFSTSLKH